MRLVLGIFAVVFIIIYNMAFKPTHQCKYAGCLYNGLETFEPFAEPMTDTYLMDSLHFYNPELSDGQLETLIFDIEN